MNAKHLFITLLLGLFLTPVFSQDTETRQSTLLNKSKAELMAFKKELMVQNLAITKAIDEAVRGYYDLLYHCSTQDILSEVATWLLYSD